METMKKEEAAKTPQNSDGDSKKKTKIRWTVLAPMLSAVLVAGCVGVSLSNYTPTVYEVQAKPVVDETEEPDEEDTEALAVGEFDLPDGTYEGTGTGYAGKITVSVEIKDKKIVSITILDVEADDDAFFNRAKGVIDKIIAAQSLDVDVVSGATYSSRGIISAVKNALTGESDSGETASQQSGGQGETSVAAVADASAYRDGTYYGSATGFAGPIQVKVVISGGKISSIEIVSTSDGSSYISKASTMISKMVSGQTTNVDTVSGATYSSVGIINAVRNALSQAAVSGSATQTAATVVNGNTSQNGNSTDPATPSVTGNYPYPDGTYYGVADGYLDDIKVAIVIKDKTLQSVTVVEEHDDDAYFTAASAVINKVITNQTTAVDTVSGATYSSKGILGAIDEALKEAKAAADGSSEDNNNTGGDSDTGDNNNGDQGGDSEDGDDSDQDAEAGVIYKNGNYTVTVDCEPIADEDGEFGFDAYNLTATIAIAGDKITGISDVSGDGDEDNDSYIKKAVEGTSTKPGMLTKIVALPRIELSEDIDLATADNKYRSSVSDLKLDTVSRATCTSKSLIQACLEALTQAKDALTQTNGTQE